MQKQFTSVVLIAISTVYVYAQDIAVVHSNERHTTMTTNEQIFGKIIEDGFSKGDLTIFDKYLSPDFVEHQYGHVPPDVEGVKTAVRHLHAAFPDFSLTIEDIISDGDKVWVRLTGRGTHTGSFGPLPPTGKILEPTGKKFEITVIDIGRFKDGKLVEHWGVPDRIAMIDQLSSKPSPADIKK
jgi:predicted ester cyclase